MAATGKKIDIGVLDLFQIRDGVLIEHWALLDNLGMLKQLGAIQDAFIAHAEAPHLQQVIGPRAKERRIHRVAAHDVLDGEDGAARRHAPDEGKAALLHQANAARCIRRERNGSARSEALEQLEIGRASCRERV